MEAYHELSDSDLVMRLNSRDRKAFAEIYERYWGVLFAHARQMLRDDEQAGDVVQDIFTNLYDRRGTLLIEGTLSSYLYKSIRNAIFNLIRREKVKVNYIDSLRSYLDQDLGKADDRIIEKELAAQIEREIELLPPKMRAIFEMSRKAHKNNTDIANELGVAKQTVEKQLYYALKILRSKFKAVILLYVMAAILHIYR